MVLKLYGAHFSPYVRLVAAVLLEKEVPFEFIAVDVSKGEHKTPEYLSKHPYGQIPCIDDDGFILYESKAICYYIASKYPDQGTPLLPVGLKATALYQQAVFSQVFNFDEHVGNAGREIFYKKFRGLTPDLKVYEKHMADLNVKLDVYDKILSKQKYIAGDEFTLADLYHAPGGFMLIHVGSNIMESKPNVARWYNDVMSRPSLQSVKNEIKSTN